MLWLNFYEKMECDDNSMYILLIVLTFLMFLLYYLALCYHRSDVCSMYLHKRKILTKKVNICDI